MKEVRLTLNAEEFGAVSQVLIDMGVGFRVEPIGSKAPETGPPLAGKSPPARRRKTSRKTAKPAAKRDALAPSGADRLREAITRNQTGAAPGAAPLPGLSYPSAPAGEPTPPAGEDDT
jgi:hypothetical protein